MNYKHHVTNNTLRETRLSLKLRQQDVADALGLQMSDRISHWENGQALPSIINLFRLCRIYKKQPHELYPVLYKQIASEKMAVPGK